MTRAAALACGLGVWAAFTGVAGGAPLGDNTVRLAPSQLKLPQNIGPLRFTGQNRFSDRRLGRSFAFNASGISLSIYVYDYGISDIPDGSDSVPLCEQFEGAKGEIERGGNYQNVVLRSEASRPLGEGPDAPTAREAVYEFDRHGIHATSVLWLTAIEGHFLKLRLSLRTEVADELDEARPEILAAIAEAVSQRRKSVPARPVPAVQEASIEVDSHYDAETGALWLTYALELVKFSREHPDTRPPCGGRLVPGYAAELAARRAALAEYRARTPDLRTSRYFDELQRVEDAGYLDEYTWTHFRDDRRDVTPSPGLQLSDFEEYRQRELLSHVAQSGARVRIITVRALPDPARVP
jgi:hypothetical protein